MSNKFFAASHRQLLTKNQIQKNKEIFRDKKKNHSRSIINTHLEDSASDYDNKVNNADLDGEFAFEDR